MMKSKFQEVDLNLFLALVNIIFLFYSCNGNVDKKEKDNIEHKIKTTGKFKDQHAYFKYNKENLIKKQSLKIDSKAYTVLFLLDQQGTFGDSNFEKHIAIPILKNDILIDEFKFSNQSILCDTELIKESVKATSLNATSNEKLFFMILESCDGEDPDILEAIIWDGKKQSHSFEIPKYFESGKDKEKLLNHLFTKESKTTFFMQTNKIIDKTIRGIINKLIEKR